MNSSENYECAGCGGEFPGEPALVERGRPFHAPECSRSFFTCHLCGRDTEPPEGGMRVESALHQRGEAPERATLCRSCWIGIVEEFASIPGRVPWRAI